jgi:hypothetical protein
LVTEPALNTMLAEYLASGLARAIRIPESRVKILRGRGGTGQPDIQIIDVLGVRVLVEGKIENFQHAIQDCKKRIDNGLADVCFAVSYNHKLAKMEDILQIREAMKTTQVEVALVKPPIQLTLTGWPDEAILTLGKIRPSQLLEILASQSIYDEIVGSESAERIANVISGILQLIERMPDNTLKSTNNRLSKILQVASGLEGTENEQ